MRRIAVFAVFSFLVFLAPVLALPGDWWGEVSVGNGTANYSVPNGTIVTAHINGSSGAAATAYTGAQIYSWYLIHVEGGTGDNVSFKVCGIDTNITVSNAQPWSEGDHAQLDLYATALSDGSSCSCDAGCTGGYCVHSTCRNTSIYCGDGYCDSGESCTADNGACGSGYACTNGCVATGGAPPSGDTGYAGGGAGVSAPPSCPVCAACGSWGSCIGGLQIRTCYKCDPLQAYTCQPYTEERACEAEKGMTAEQAAEAIAEASSAIESARAQGKDVSAAEALMSQALQKYDEKDYAASFRLAEQSKEAALGAGLIKVVAPYPISVEAALVVIIIAVTASALLLRTRKPWAMTAAELKRRPEAYEGRRLMVHGSLAREKVSETTGFVWYTLKDYTGSIIAASRLRELGGTGKVYGYLKTSKGTPYVQIARFEKD